MSSGDSAYYSPGFDAEWRPTTKGEVSFDVNAFFCQVHWHRVPGEAPGSPGAALYLECCLSDPLDTLGERSASSEVTP